MLVVSFLLFGIEDEVCRFGDIRHGDLSVADRFFAVECPRCALRHLKSNVAGAEEFDQLTVMKVRLHYRHCYLTKLCGVLRHRDEHDLEKSVAHIDLVFAELDNSADRARIADRAEREVGDYALALRGGADRADRLDLEEIIDARKDVCKVAEVILDRLRCGI